MSSQSSIQAEVETLCGELLEGTTTDEQRKRLEDLVLNNPDAKRTYIEYINLHAALCRYNPANMAQEDIINEISDRNGTTEKSSSPMLGFLGDCFQQGASFFFKSNVFSLLVAVGLPGLVLGALVFGLMTQSPPENAVAVIKSLHRCEGHAGDGHSLYSLYSGMNLYRGQTITLNEGLVELEFAHGARAVLQAPTTFDVRNGNAAYLRVGRLAANVPPRARGFIVATPSAQIVDLGTDFGVSVAVDGTAETHVFKGKVAVATKTTADNPMSSTTYLKAGQAARISLAQSSGKAPRVVAMAATPKQFVRNLPVLPKPKPRIRFAHYGNADPMAEGWTLQAIGEDGRLRDRKSDPAVIGSVNDGGTAAWMMDNRVHGREARYSILLDKGFSPKTLEEARKKGWVMRARIKLDEVMKDTEREKSICHCIYHDITRVWALFPTIKQNGEMVLILHGKSSLGQKACVPIPNGRNRYVDYEVRYNPATDDAEVFIDGRRVATQFYGNKGPKSELTGIQFGLHNHVSKARFAMVEFEVLGQ